MKNEITTATVKTAKEDILTSLEDLLTKKLLEKYYPLTLDQKNGGFLCNLTYDWKFADPQDKMIVTQARHTWTPAKASQFFPDDPRYMEAVLHGYNFLEQTLWDHEYGGFYTMVNPAGGISDYRGYFQEKRTYGNAFGIYALAAVYEVTKNEDVLNFAINAFEWIEAHAYDREKGGYFQFLTREGTPFSPEDIENTKASDKCEAYFKDQNSSIHLIEAYTELYRFWPNEKLKTRLNELLLLIRDIITTEKGHMNLFFDHDWKAISFREADEKTREENYGLDHVSFGHDYETAFLMLEASHALGIENDVKTLRTAKKMVDHAIENGFDQELGGFYDAGYYFKGSDKCTIIKPVKNWWSQAEGLNSLLLMYRIFPEEEKYYAYFIKLFNYINTYFIDQQFGGWFEGGIDKEPHLLKGPKGHIWKAAYHEGRSLMNCIKLLSDKEYDLYKTNSQFNELKNHSDSFISHWQALKNQL